MVWCGFDVRMRSGIVLYAEGVAKAIEAKARETGVSVSAQLIREKEELGVLDALVNERLARATDAAGVTSQLKAFGGMIAIARLFIESPTAVSEIGNGFEAAAYDLGTLIHAFDSHYATLPSNLDHPTNARTTLASVIPEMQPAVSVR
jgi:hypothetical protein